MPIYTYRVKSPLTFCWSSCIQELYTVHPRGDFLVFALWPGGMVEIPFQGKKTQGSVHGRERV